MQGKLTLRLDDRLIARAKALSRPRDTSLSEVVARFFAQLTEPDQQSDEAKLSTWTRRLLGAARVPGKPIGSDEDVQRNYVDYLEAKYR